MDENIIRIVRELRGGGTVGSAGGKKAKRHRCEASLEVKKIRRYEDRLLTETTSFLPLLGKDKRMGNNQYPPQPSRIRERVSCHCEGATHVDLPVSQRKYVFTLAKATAHAALSNKQRKCAFTLAEVLITLGIIAVVAAITIPGLIADYQKKVLVSQFKKSYSNLSNALNLVQAEYGGVYDCYVPSAGAYHTDECKPFFDNYLKKLNIIKECSDWRNKCHPTYKNKSEVLAAGGEVNNSACSFDIDSFTTYYTLADGSLFALQNYGNPQHHQVFPVVDVNGMKGPNKWGYDLYMLTFHRKNDGQNVILSNRVCAMKEKGGMFLKEVLGE